jgi:hypothetical protein
MQTITLQLSDTEWQILQDELVDPEGWIGNFTLDRIRRQKARIIATEQQNLIDDPAVETIPATEEGILESYFSRPGYQTRAQQVESQDPGEP